MHGMHPRVCAGVPPSFGTDPAPPLFDSNRMSSQAEVRQGSLLLDVPLRVAPSVPAESRHAINSVLGDLDPSVRQAFVLISNELVTNAVVHARRPKWLRVRQGAGSLRVEVADSTSQGPLLRSPTPQQPHGRGMALVVALADDWGVDFLPDGKVVWAELALRRS